MLWLTLAALAQDTTSEPQTESTESTATDAPVEPEPAPEPKAPPVVHTFDTVGALPSALDKHTAAPEGQEFSLSDLALASGLELGDLDRPLLIHGSWFVRPQFQVAQLIGAESNGPAALRVGLEAGRRYTTIQQLPVQAHAELGLRVSAPMFGAVGHRSEAFVNLGPWLGPVRVQAGFGARYERERWRRRTLELASDVLLGPEVGVAIDAGPLNVDAALQPLFALGDRASATASTAVLPVLGHETLYTVGLGIQPGPIGLRAKASWRETSIGGILEVGANLTIDPGAL